MYSFLGWIHKCQSEHIHLKWNPFPTKGIISDRTNFLTGSGVLVSSCSSGTSINSNNNGVIIVLALVAVMVLRLSVVETFTVMI